ncbi:MAG: FtsW/RodA/SpoVE family cell cycle protein, partial [Ramlibacter sp.]
MNADLSRMGGWLGLGGADKPRGTGYASAPARVQGVDQPLVWVTVALLAFGLVMVYSASIAMPDNPRFANYAHTHFLVRHLFSLALAFVVALLVFQVPMATWEKAAPWLFIASLVLLMLVLIPHVGKGVNGARRWISLGFMSFQPSELAKFAVLLYAADYMVRKMDVKERFFRAVLPMATAVAVVGVLLLAEPDMGAFMVIAVIAMGILFLGGVNARMFFLIAAVMTVAFVLMIALSDWRRERIFA